MHLAHGGIVHFVLGEEHGFAAETWNFSHRGRKGLRRLPDRNQRECNLALTVDIEQPIDIIIHKAAKHFGRKPQGRADGQQVSQ